MAPNVLDMDSPEFLTTCLKVALFENNDIVDDIAEACQLNGITAVTLGRGILTVPAMAEKLFLTEEEAQKVLSVCQSMVDVQKSANTGDSDSEAVSLSLRLAASNRLQVQIVAAGTQAVSTTADSEASIVPAEAAKATAEEVITETETTSALDVEPSDIDLAFEDSGLPPIAESPEPELPAPKATAAATTPKATPRAAATSPRPYSQVPSRYLQIPSPKMAADPSRAPTTPPKSSPRPKSAVSPSAAFAGSVSTNLRKSVSLKVDTESSPAHTPSYLRTTEAAKIRASRDTPLPKLSPTAPELPGAARRKSLFSKLGSTLLAPTAAFVARITGREAEKKEAAGPVCTKSMAQLADVMASPQGQRVTKAQPFHLNTELRPKSCVLSREELDLIEAKEKAFKRHVVPKHVHESRPLEFRAASTPQQPQDLFVPFQLASLSRHTAQVEANRLKVEAERAAEEEARTFKAMSFNKKLTEGAIVPPKPTPAAPTQGTMPVSHAEARIAHYHANVEPAKKAKEAEQNKEKLEEERRAKELEDMKVEDFRKTLEFKAMVMPDFSSPFRPDPSKAAAVTQSSEFSLNTDKRLGKAPSLSAREDREGPGLGKGVYDGSGYVDPFMASLRGSGSNAMRRSMQVGAGGGSMRRSANVASRSAMMHQSVGSALQAAIRAAAQDAQRDMNAKAAVQALDSRRSTASDMGLANHMVAAV